MGRVLMLAVAGIAGGVGLSMYGRFAVRRELAPLGEADASSIASQMSTYEALAAGARKLTGRNAVAYAGSVTVQQQ